MCGIFAALTKSPLSDRQLSATLDELNHRGPDGKGLWKSKDGCWTLGHTRLSIIGLNNGAQPMSAKDGEVHLVANGEFYGYRAIRRELIEAGANLDTESDSEIALHLYRQKGLASLESLRGEFAFVIADERRRMMIAVRDRFGIKPLYYAQIDGNVYFASEIKALFSMGVPAKWDVAGACGGLGRCHERSPFAGIRNVPPGHYAIAQDGDVKLYPYWDWEFPTINEIERDERSDSDLIEGFREVLADAVRTRLVADVEVACYLSGGIDSCAVLGLAQREMSRPIRAFSLCFEEALYDESALARKHAETVGAEFTPIPITGRDIADNFANAVRHSEMPMFNGHGIAKYILSREVRDAGVKVVFTGEGADEMLGGYTPFRVDAITNNLKLTENEKEELIAGIFGTNEATRALFLPGHIESRDLDGVRARLGWLPGFTLTYAGMAGNLPDLMLEGAREQMSAIDPISDALDRLPIQNLQGRHPLNQALYLCSKTQLPTMILNYLGDRMEMAHSIEGRVPFLDHHVAEYVAKLPVDLKVKGAREKHILREATKDVLLPEVYDREKHPFTTPPVRKKSDPMFEFYHDVFASQAAQDQPIFDIERANGLLDDYLDCPADQQIAKEAQLQTIASIVSLQEHFAASSY